MNKTVRVALITLLCVLATACGKKQEVRIQEIAPPVAPVNQSPPESFNDEESLNDDGKYKPADLSTDDCLLQRVVYFDFDQSRIKPEFQHIIACHARYLQDRPFAHIRLEGNTDERGTHEYNLGLGDRRANAVANALGIHGAALSQISVISYGKEKPVCREHNEDCWNRNRRVEIVYTTR